MTVAAKCNITKLALEELNKLLYGVGCDSQENQNAIAENYAQYLDCPDVDIEICNDEDCNNDAIVLGCDDFVINSITMIPGDVDDLIRPSFLFSLLPTDYVGGSLPFIYTWSFDTSIWELVEGTVNDATIHLIIKAGVDTDVAVGRVTVAITDLLGCQATKSCYWVLYNLICSADFPPPCPNPSNLVVENV